MQLARTETAPVIIGLDLSSKPDLSAEAVYDDAGQRGSGRTAAQLAALPDGAAYLVHSMKFADYCQRLLVHAGRRRDAIVFITPVNCEAKVTGRRFPAYDVDHAYYDLTGSKGWFARDYLAVACACLPPRS